ncbi:MAG TPA: DUF5996 family protein [Candidatus Methylomirabilis sp.]|nr:DUF5996 family protein [Candidatus Methylomirabilis sp.]
MDQQVQIVSRNETWPPLPLAEWQDTYATLHRWTQIVGKVRLAQAPMLNQWWQVPLYVTTRGLTTSPIPYGDISFEIGFDFLAHELRVQTSNDAVRTLVLAPRSVADFYREFMAVLRALGLEIKIWPMPVEVPDPIPFEQDDKHHSYVPEQARRFWLVLKQADRVLQQFRCGFIGKCSPVHFFWGSFDLAVTRFSGRSAPPHPGGIPHMADWVTRLAYSHEVSSCGFWPGGGPVPEPVFYAYAYPEPDGFKNFPVRPQAAHYSNDMHEFLLPYEAVRRAGDPDAIIRDFAQSTYEAAADRGGWDRHALEYAASDGTGKSE